MLRRLRFDLFIYHFLALCFFINAIFLFRIIISWEKYLWVWKTEPWSENDSKAEFVVDILFWRFYSIIFGIVLIAVLNWKRKIHYINTILISIISLSLFAIGFFKNDFFRFIFKPREIIAQQSYYNFLIFSVLFMIIAVFLFSLPWKKGTTHNSRL